MEPAAVLLFLVIWLFSAMAASRRRSRRPPRGDWPRLPGRPQPAAEPPARVEPPPEVIVPAAVTPAPQPVREQRIPIEPPLEPKDRDEAFFDFFEPGRVVSAVVLSEIIGPPRCRRPGPGFFRYYRRNRLYSGGGREGGAERGTDSE